MRILLIEDDREAAAYLCKALREAGHVPDHAQDGDSGAAMAAEGGYDVLVVDRMLPRRDGLSIIEDLRKRGDHTPTLILSALGQVDDRVTGLRAGGDDYLPKPYAFSELARAGRGPRPAEQARRSRDDLPRRRPRARPAPPHRRAAPESPSRCSPREFRLLEYLMKHAGQVVTRTMLLENVWDYHFDPQTNVIDVHVSRLRGKIDKGFGEPLLHTVRGAGYMIRGGAR